MTTSDQNEESIHMVSNRKLDFYNIKKVYRNDCRETINRYHQCFHTKYLVFALQAVAVKISAVVFCCYLTSFVYTRGVYSLLFISSIQYYLIIKRLMLKCVLNRFAVLYNKHVIFKVNISIFTKYVTYGYEMSNDVAIYWLNINFRRLAVNFIKILLPEIELLMLSNFFWYIHKITFFFRYEY